MGKKKVRPTTPAVIARQVGKSLALGAGFGGRFAGTAKDIYRHLGDAMAVDTQTSPIQEQVHVYLKRLRHSVVFPFNIEEVYFECVPSIIKDWIMAGYFKSPQSIANVRVRNMVRMLMGQGRLRQWTGPGDDRVGKSRASVNLGGTTKVFWLMLPFVAPHTSTSTEHPLEYPSGGEHLMGIARWLDLTEKLDAEIEDYYQRVRMLGQILPTSRYVRAVFPELLSFVKMDGAHTPPVDRNETVKLKLKVGAVLTDTQQDNLITLLAAATLLPEEKNLLAWSGYT